MLDYFRFRRLQNGYIHGAVIPAGMRTTPPERGTPETKNHMIPPVSGPYRYSKCIHARSPKIFLPMEVLPKIFYLEDLAKTFSPAGLGQNFFCVGIGGKGIQKEQLPEAARSFCRKMVLGPIGILLIIQNGGRERSVGAITEGSRGGVLDLNLRPSGYEPNKAHPRNPLIIKYFLR